MSSRTVEIWRGVPDSADRAPTGRGTLLHEAVSRACSPEEAGRLLDSGLEVDARDRFGCTALHHAAFVGSVPLVELLAARGADVNAVDVVGYAPIDHANLKLEVIRALLALGASPEGGDHIPDWGSYSWPLLLTAVYFGRADVVSVLIGAGADVSRHPEALPLAAKQGKVEVVRCLLKAGAALDGTTSWRGRDRPPLEAAAMYASMACVELLLPRCRGEIDAALEAAVALSLDDSPVPPNDRRAARLEVVDRLLREGARPDPALLAAATLEDASYADRLLAAGAAVETVDDEGRTPLFLAALWGRPAVLRRLLAAGADPRARDRAGESAYDAAKRDLRGAPGDVMAARSLIADAGGGPPRPPPAAPEPSGPRVGGRVAHPKLGEGVIAGIEGAGEAQKLAIDFASGGRKVVLAKFVALVEPADEEGEGAP